MASKIIRHLRGVDEATCYELPWTVTRTCELAADRIEALERVLDAAENVCIAHGMGWDLDGVLAVLDDAARRARARALLAKEASNGE